MSTTPTYFEDVSLMVTHYNRSQSLERLLSEMKRVNCQFKEIVVSDDGSKQEHLDYIAQLKNNYDFKLVTTPKNKGLGNNLNKGQDAVETPYTLYIQEDFILLNNFASNLANGLALLKEHPDFDMVRFYAYNKYPYLKKCRDGFSEMLFKWWYPGLDKFAYYSDHPHLRRTTFPEKFGRYREGVSGDKTEFAMMMSFLKNKGKAFFYDAHKSALEQVNSAEEPSTMHRNRWRNSDNFFIRNLRTIYRYFNCYSGLFFRKF
ncbi:glycosyltransferase family 2 protein [Pedobacter africanus]|uniref:Glycosyltransferase involved in cell wall bisynthesis n=1 Tax=Pedobacter africanus TaxID=151894 RepID=A0A1W2DFQ9_9SPHI|nr:glycosyltransferase [Pedobacter africanus]SMC95962.1 Glycosyltransferase involved in cell wall bisynthesis [Pedobacter africanus]